MSIYFSKIQLFPSSFIDIWTVNQQQPLSSTHLYRGWLSVPYFGNCTDEIQFSKPNLSCPSLRCKSHRGTVLVSSWLSRCITSVSKCLWHSVLHSSTNLNTLLYQMETQIEPNPLTQKCNLITAAFSCIVFIIYTIYIYILIIHLLQFNYFFYVVFQTKFL